MSIFERLAAWIPGQWEKVIITAVLIGLAFLVSNLWTRYLARMEISAEKRRMQLVWVRNVIWFVAMLIIVSVWASTIAGFALSLAAVAGAILIVSKELVMCIHGYLYVTLVQPFKIGDVIEFPRRAVYAGSMPFNETIQSEFTTAITEGGQWVDRIEKRSAGSASMTVNNLSEMWQAEVIQPLLTFMQGAPVFIADRPEPFPLSVAYGFTSKRPQPARSIANALIARNLTLDLVSHVSA